VDVDGPIPLIASFIPSSSIATPIFFAFSRHTFINAPTAFSSRSSRVFFGLGSSRRLRYSFTFCSASSIDFAPRAARRAPLGVPSSAQMIICARSHFGAWAISSADRTEHARFPPSKSARVSSRPMRMYRRACPLPMS
jgi:hypothetical protein